METLTQNVSKSLKIVLTGPESSGKSTLCAYLSEHFSAPMVEEYAREYLVSRDGNYVEADLLDIARGQEQLIKSALADNPPVVFIDTAFVVLEVWSEYRFGRVDRRIRASTDRLGADLYLLCKPDIPWQADPLRENPGDRDELFGRYHELLEARQMPFKVIEGSLDQRVESALIFVDDLAFP